MRELERKLKRLKQFNADPYLIDVVKAELEHVYKMVMETRNK
jgi:hypothetical protein